MIVSIGVESIGVLPVDSSSVSGTAAITNADDTSAASGTTTIVGTSATTNSNDTSNASGTVGGGSVTGTSATTNSNDTSSAAGYTAIIGTAAVTNANDTCSAGSVVEYFTAAQMEEIARKLLKNVPWWYKLKLFMESV